MLENDSEQKHFFTVRKFSEVMICFSNKRNIMSHLHSLQIKPQIYVDLLDFILEKVTYINLQICKVNY
eukprot:COSAG01_NODE_47_length_32024_cov_1294.553579_18_plen_68_part_00